MRSPLGTAIDPFAALTGATRELAQHQAAMRASDSPLWERWTIDELADGVARVVVTRPRDTGRIERLAGRLVDLLADGGSTRGAVRALVRDEVQAAESALDHESWEPEVGRFALIDPLARFLARRAGKPGLPGNRPLREGDVFWVLAPSRPSGDAVGDGLSLAGYEAVGADVWDVTAAARQAAKQSYASAVANSEPTGDSRG